MPSIDPQLPTSDAPEPFEAPVSPTADRVEALANKALTHARRTRADAKTIERFISDKVFREYIGAIEKASEDPATFEQVKKKLMLLLAQRAEQIWSEQTDHRTVKAWLATLKMFAELAGILVTQKVNVNINSGTDINFLRFKKATSGLSDDQFELVFAFASNLPRKTAPIIDAKWFPPQSSNAEVES